MGYLLLLIAGETVYVLLGEGSTLTQERSIFNDHFINHFRAGLAITPGSQPVSSNSLTYKVVNN